LHKQYVIEVIFLGETLTFHKEELNITIIQLWIM